jgi:transcriptional regulator with XRE-family HTH domain
MSPRRGDQKNLAKELGITAKHLSDILNSRRHPSLEMAIKLEEHTGIHRCAWLFPDEYRNPFMKKAKGRLAPPPVQARRPVQDRSNKRTSKSALLESEEIKTASTQLDDPAPPRST